MRFRTLLLPVAALGLLASCGDAKVTSSANTNLPKSETSTPGGSTASAPATPDTNVSGSEPLAPPAANALPKPEVKIPAALPTKLEITDLTEGSGAAAVAGDTVVVHYVGVRSADGKEFDNSYDRGQPFPVESVGSAQVIDGWNQGLIGVKQGGRRQLDIPPDLAYGDNPQGDIIQAGDALTFVIDVVAVIPKANPADAPAITIPATPNQATLTFTDLVVGTGAGIEPGQTVAVQLIAFSAVDGKQLDSTWTVGAPASFLPDDPQTLPFLATGVEGMKIGGRRQVVVPFADAFGPDGNPDLGLPASTDLILVLDLVAVY
jgi:peptidylprolyl isomerase